MRLSRNEYGATISDVPPTVALRPLVVIDISAAVRADPGYHAQPSDVLEWEALHGTVPKGSVGKQAPRPNCAPLGIAVEARLLPSLL